MQTPWHFTTWLDLLDHWQSLAAGLIALLAAVVAVGGGEFFARQKERREVAAIRASLSAEIRHYIEILILTHDFLARLIAEKEHLARTEMAAFIDFPEPTVYPAAADRIGRLGPLAADVTEFYVAFQALKFVWRIRVDRSKTSWAVIAETLEDFCQQSLPLFSALPINDADLKAKIEGMSKL
jgi:hypothetical protein